MQFPATPTRNEDGTTTVRFRDLPEAITFVEAGDDLVSQAADCLQEVLAARIADREPIPEPSFAEAADIEIWLPSLTAAKALLWRAMLREGVRKAELARRLNTDQKGVDRLLDFKHASRPDQLDAAFAAMGLRLVMDTTVLRQAS